ncbi:hypothetical protein ENHAE0001_0662 [Enhydrobacter aerosaccus SK60]|nr:hypothetical protein ENHAE0001_0662 [Enhydrobacter aerosaccus SK60]
MLRFGLVKCRSPSHRWFRKVTATTTATTAGSPSHRWFRKFSP